MPSDICFSCNRLIQDHTKEEATLCALKLSRKGDFAEIPSGVSESRNQLSTSSSSARGQEV